ncbi:hydroxyneurosporene synthase [bacterium BMS3Abin03]|nr:hydroxyneurosporene synthase [bacterium BMS3Abin03]
MIIQNISIKLYFYKRYYKILSILLYSTFFIIALVQPVNAQTLKYPDDDGRHEDADFEAWSLFTHIETDDGLQFGVAIFFFTGKIIGIKASGLYAVVADVQKKEYQDFSKIQLPLFSSTTHTVGRLMENYSDNVLERNPIGGPYNVKIEMDDFSISLKYNPLKKPVDIGQLAVSDEGFNRVYAIPRGKVSAQMLYAGKEYQLDGIGIFQHQWGDKPEQDALSDIFALHFNDTTDVLIYHSGTFPEINTMLLSDSNGEYRILHKFTANADTILSVELSNDKFKLDWQFRSPENQFEIKISPSFKGQEIEMLGLSYWLSRCKVVMKKRSGETTGGIGYVYIGFDKP